MFLPCKTVLLASADYPDNLKQIANPPGKIFVCGNVLASDSLAVAIVGTRRMSENGARIAFEFARVLAKAKVTIVSGLAYGIDTVVHKAVVSVGGRAIAVLGHGLDRIYPFANRFLAQQIVKNGALISEYPVGTIPFPKNFLIRNRIVSGLAKAVLVIEGARRSGTLSTVTWAANQGREVFVIPGSEITDYLISQGATIAKKPEDILEYLNSQ